MSQKQELGKGLNALLSNINKNQASVIKPQGTSEAISQDSLIQLMPLHLIKANPNQPRNQFDEEKIEELVLSIKNFGIIQPITVRKIGNDEYQIISGERRFRAAKLAGLSEIPSYIRKANDQELLEMALIENIQREDLNPIEIAISYQMLVEEFKLTHEGLADRVGKKRSTISNYTRLLKLAPEIQNAVKSNQISMGHARVLVGMDDLIQQLHLFKELQNKKLSVRECEQLAAKITKQNSRKVVSDKKPIDHDIKTIENKISAFFGVKANLKRKSSGEGQIIIRFDSDHALNDILDRLDA